MEYFFCYAPEVMYYNAHGEAITLFEWMNLFSMGSAYKLVGNYESEDYLVSTIWIGIDASINGQPLIFETMIFGGKYNQMCWHYSTEELAREGHDSVVACLKEGKSPTNLLIQR